MSYVFLFIIRELFYLFKFGILDEEIILGVFYVFLYLICVNIL